MKWIFVLAVLCFNAQAKDPFGCEQAPSFCERLREIPKNRSSCSGSDDCAAYGIELATAISEFKLICEWAIDRRAAGQEPSDEFRSLLSLADFQLSHMEFRGWGEKVWVRMIGRLRELRDETKSLFMRAY